MNCVARRRVFWALFTALPRLFTEVLSTHYIKHSVKKLWAVQAAEMRRNSAGTADSDSDDSNSDSDGASVASGDGVAAAAARHNTPQQAVRAQVRL